MSEPDHPVLQIAPPEDNVPRLSFAEHHEYLDRFIEDCRHWLRNTTGYHGCEAQVIAGWDGRPFLIRHEMTNAQLPNGAPMTITVQCVMPVPWLTKEPTDHADIMRQALLICEKAIESEKVKHKCLRISFAGYARAVSLTLATPPVKENGRQTAIALP